MFRGQSEGVNAVLASRGYLSVGLLFFLASLSGCQQLNPNFRWVDDTQQGATSDGDQGPLAATSLSTKGASAGLGTDASQGETVGDDAHALQPTTEQATTQATGVASEPPDTSTAESVTTSSDETSSSTETAWDYCGAPVSLCLNMNDPERPSLKPDPLVFNRGENASYAVSDTPKWPEVTWLNVKGVNPVFSDKPVEISTLHGTDEDQLGMDVWVRHSAESANEVLVSLEHVMALGRSGSLFSADKIRCNKFSDAALLTAGVNEKWFSTSIDLKNAGEWQHVACYAVGKRFGIWYRGETNEARDNLLDPSDVYINTKTQAKIILGSSDWLVSKAGESLTTSSPDVAGLRIWTDIETMIKVLNEEHMVAN